MKVDKDTQLVREAPERKVYRVEIRTVNGYTEQMRHVPGKTSCEFLFSAIVHKMLI